MVYLAIVGTRDNPIYELELYTGGGASAQQKVPAAPTSTPLRYGMYLKVVDRFNEHSVSAYVTPSGAKFMLVHDTSVGDVRGFFAELHELYIKVLMNPFMEINAPIESQQFDVKVRGIARRYLA
ncbi:TRAPP subunit [Podochytrium sp. JEL0797]|nr:TRAPP subunit [Podochytrium sp. JEL0797]